MVDHLKNIEAECAVLGAILLDNSLASVALGWLKPDAFYDSRNKEIFTAISELHHQDKAIDYLSIENETNVSADYISSLTDSVPSTSNLETYCKIVRKSSIIRYLCTLYASERAELENTGNIDDSIARVNTAINQVSSSQTRTAQNILEETLDKIESYQSGDMEGYLTTGYDQLDAKYAPSAGDMVVVGARPSVGKTAFGLNVAEKMVSRGKPALFISLEMTAEAITRRRISMYAEINSGKLKQRQALTSTDWDGIATAARMINKSNLWVVDRVNGFSGLLSTIRKYALGQGCKAAFVDYLQLIDFGRHYRSRYEAITSASTAIKSLAKELGITIYLLSQLNRESEKRDSKMPRVSDLRESGQIEQDADLIYLLHRPGKYDLKVNDGEYVPQDKTLSVIVAKNRDGATGKCDLQIDLPTGNIKEIWE